MASTVALPSQGSLPGAASARPKLCHARCQLASGMATTASAAAVAWEAEAMAVPAKRARVWRTASSVAGMWKEVQGCGDWEGLLQPLHPVVRDEVARYGELVDACYKAFDLDPSSRRYLNCKYGKQGMLAEVGMAGAGYEVTKYIYASPDVEVPTMEASTSGRWIGYVAVSDDDQTRRLGRRDILVSFRGTVTPAEWFANLRSSLVPARLDPCDPRPDVKVESGFLSLYTSSDGTCRFGGGGSCREQLLREVSRLVEEQSKSRPGDDISITLAGHSMGSALALLCGYDLAELGINRDASGRRVPVTVFSFGGPRVGNVQFKARCDELGVKALRVANVRDPVTKLPGLFLNEGSAALLGQLSGSCYTHVGVELPLDFFNMGNLAGAHDLPSYITLLKRDENIKARPATKEDDRKGVLARVKQLVGRRRAAALPWPGAALQVGDFVHQWLGSAAN